MLQCLFDRLILGAPMKKFLTILTAAAVAYFGLAAPAEAGRRSRSDVPPPVVIDRTVFTPVVSGL